MEGYSVWWGSDYWFVIVCGGAVITGFLLCVVGQWWMDGYCVWWGIDYWFVIVCGGAVITSWYCVWWGSD